MKISELMKGKDKEQDQGSETEKLNQQREEIMKEFENKQQQQSQEQPQEEVKTYGNTQQESQKRIIHIGLTTGDLLPVEFHAYEEDIPYISQNIDIAMETGKVIKLGDFILSGSKMVFVRGLE